MSLLYNSFFLNRIPLSGTFYLTMENSIEYTIDMIERSYGVFKTMGKFIPVKKRNIEKMVPVYIKEEYLGYYYIDSLSMLTPRDKIDLTTAFPPVQCQYSIINNELKFISDIGKVLKLIASK